MSAQTISRKTSSLVFIALLALLALSVGVARVDLGEFNVAVALAISSAKALLIVVFFMHVLDSSPLVRLAAAGSLLWLAILLVLLLSDYFSRGPGGVP